MCLEVAVRCIHPVLHGVIPDLLQVPPEFRLVPPLPTNLPVHEVQVLGEEGFFQGEEVQGVGKLLGS